MRSRADWSARRRAERLAHAAALMLLAWALVEAVRARPAPREPVTGAATPEVLAAWSTGRAPPAVHAELTALPGPVERAWLAALARSGTRVTWSGDSLLPLAASVQPIADPRGGHLVRVAAPIGASVVLADAAGVLDTARIASAGATLGIRALVGGVRAATITGRGRANTVVPTGEDRGEGATTLPSPALGRSSPPDDRSSAPARPGRAAEAGGARRPVALPRGVLVLGGASWESRFTIAALEEAGWRVGARIAVAPGAWVEQGTPSPIDTSRYSAVVVLDTMAEPWAEDVARFAARGGGVVIAGRAAVLRGLRDIAPGSPGEYVPAEPGALPDSAPRRALGVHPIAMRSADALVLERRGPLITVAARRHLLGRVVQIGHDDTWRWRMAGDEDAPRAHRDWWSLVLSSVAYVPVAARSPSPPVGATDAAPYTQLVGAIGAPGTAPAAARAPRPAMPWWMLPIATMLLVGSWGSRRLRGAS